MSALERGNAPQPIIGEDGKPIPGLFAFDSLPRDPKIEKEIAIAVIENERQKALAKLG